MTDPNETTPPPEGGITSPDFVASGGEFGWQIKPDGSATFGALRLLPIFRPLLCRCHSKKLSE